MNLLKKLVFSSLSFLMFFGVKEQIFAATESPTIESALLSRGYPQIVIDNLDEDSITRIYEDSELEFMGASILKYNEDSQEFVELQVLEDGTVLGDLTKGQISTTDLTLTWNYSSKFSTNPRRLSEIDVTYSYNWKKLPAFR